mmetsp:Transcript_2251/g.2168  ORF Transcript_2251/g.2168 Transcript_2251/m.2168 type:complete len:89 (+) Transcript_2251:410-676(+)
MWPKENDQPSSHFKSIAAIDVNIICVVCHDLVNFHGGSWHNLVNVWAHLQGVCLGIARKEEMNKTSQKWVFEKTIMSNVMSLLRHTIV